MSEKLDYNDKKVPSNYKCSVCKKSGVKLWRQYNTIASAIDLLCADDAVRDQGEHFMVASDGTHEGELGRSDQIGWLVPAVPTEECDTYWGYTSVPQSGVYWWKRLPLR